MAPIPAGARVVLIDERVAKLSLAERERGLGLQWRAGASGRDKFGQSYTALEAGKCEPGAATLEPLPSARGPESGGRYPHFLGAPSALGRRFLGRINPTALGRG